MYINLFSIFMGGCLATPIKIENKLLIIIIY